MSREFPKNPEPKITLPTVGRIVHVFGMTDFGIMWGSPRAAIVAFVDPIDSLTINVGVWNTDGSTGPIVGLKHKSKINDVTGFTPCWDWMDFQKGQAAKTEQLERDLGKLQAGAPSPDKRASGPEEDGKR